MWELGHVRYIHHLIFFDLLILLILPNRCGLLQALSDLKNLGVLMAGISCQLLMLQKTFLGTMILNLCIMYKEVT